MRRLLFLTLGAMVPAALIGMMFIGYDYYDRERTRLIRDSLATTRAMAAAVDSEFVTVQAGLIVLANSNRITEADFKRFHAEALDVLGDLRSRQGTHLINMILSDRTGRQLMNTARPYGTPLPTSGDPGGLDRAVQSDAPIVSDLFVGPVIKRYGIGVAVPVKRNGAALYRLTAGISTEHLSALLKQQNLPQGWIAVVLDTKGTVVARTHDEARFIGQKASPELARRATEVREDAFESRTLEGIPVLSIFSRAPISGYTVAIGIPQSELVSNLLYSLARLFVVGFMALALAVGLTYLLGRRFLR